MTEGDFALSNSIGQMSTSKLEKRNIQLGRKRTSVRLEPVFWEELKSIAKKENMTVHALCTHINQHKLEDTSLSSALRVFVLTYVKAFVRGA